jgi:hypothetical protein
MGLEIKSVNGRASPEWLPFRPPACTNFYSQHPEIRIRAIPMKGQNLTFSNKIIHLTKDRHWRILFPCNATLTSSWTYRTQQMPV